MKRNRSAFRFSFREIQEKYSYAVGFKNHVGPNIGSCAILRRQDRFLKQQYHTDVLGSTVRLQFTNRNLANIQLTYELIPSGMEIGLISDTHSYLDPRVFKLFEDCDEVWHAGDFGQGVAQPLTEGFDVFRGVFGNIDDDEIKEQFPEDLRFDCAGVDVWMTHIAGRPGRYDQRVSTELKKNPPDVLICGHSHILHVEKDARFNQMQYLNPGAAGHHGFHLERTLLKFTIAKGELSRIRLIELGARGHRPKRKENSPG